MLYITWGIGFFLCLIAIVLLVIFHAKDKKKIVPVILYTLGFVLFLGSGFLYSKGFELKLPEKEPADDAQASEPVDESGDDLSNDYTNIEQSSDTPMSDITENDNNLIVFDALQYKFTEPVTGSFLTVTESELIENLGEPEKIDEWKYNNGTGLEYPIRSLIYENGNYVYEFNNNRLIRIQIFEQLSFENKDDILSIFGLAKTGSSKTLDTGVTYKVTDCGIHELQCTFGREDNTIDITFISYADLFD